MDRPAPALQRPRRRPPPPWRRGRGESGAEEAVQEQEHQQPPPMPRPSSMASRLLLVSLLLLSRLAVLYAFQPRLPRPPSTVGGGAGGGWRSAGAATVARQASATTGFIPPSPADDGPPQGRKSSSNNNGSRRSGGGKSPSSSSSSREAGASNGRAKTDAEAAAAAAAETAERLAGVRARVGKGGAGNLGWALQELRALRRSARLGQLAAAYGEVLAGCRHKGGANAYATKLLPVAQEAALLAMADCGADAGLQRDAKGVLRALARTGDADGAVRLLDALCGVQAQAREAVVVDEQLFFVAIKACGAAAAAAASGTAAGSALHHLRSVERLLQRMRALGVAGSPFVYSAACKAFAGGGPAWLPQVEALAKEMLAPSPPPPRPRGKAGSGAPAGAGAGVDLVAVNSLLDAFARCGDAARALGLLERMEGRAGIGAGPEGSGQPDAGVAAAGVLPRPDAFSYNIVLRALGEQGDVGGALALYDRMRLGSGSGSGSGGKGRARGGQPGATNPAAPDAVTVNTLVAACARAGSLGRALGVLRSSPVPASVEGYSALVHAFASRGDTQRAQEVLGAMEAAGVRPNARTYASLMRAAAEAGDGAARARELLRMMALQGEMDPLVRPTARTVNGALGALVRRGQLAAALELREEMAALGVAPDAATCNALLDGFLNRADPPRVREAEALFLDMLEAGPAPDAFTFATLLAAYQPPPPPAPRRLRVPGPPNPVDLLQRLPGLPGALLGGGNRAEEEDEDGASGAAGDAAVDASASGILPGPDRVLEMVRLRNGRATEAGAGAGAGPVVLDTTAVNTLLVAYAREGAVKKALAAFEDFKRGNLTTAAAEAAAAPGRPDVVTYTVLVKAVAQTDNMYAGQKIMALYREMRGDFGVQPDLQLAYALVNSFVRARSRVGGLEMEDLEEVFADLRQLGWRADTLARLERRAASFLLGLYSEAWKEGGGGGERRQRRQQPPTASERLFEKYNWNRIESGFSGF